MLFFLPAYAPEPNPDEWVWKNVKHDQIGRVGIQRKSELFELVTYALQRLQLLSDVVRGFFRDPSWPTLECDQGPLTQFPIDTSTLTGGPCARLKTPFADSPRLVEAHTTWLLVSDALACIHSRHARQMISRPTIRALFAEMASRIGNISESGGIANAGRSTLPAISHEARLRRRRPDYSTANVFWSLPLDNVMRCMVRLSDA